MVGKNRYYLIACGTSSYHPEYSQLPGVETDIKKVVNLFTQNFGYKQVLTNLQLNPNKNALEEEFSKWLRDKERSNRDIVIFYYSGHGEYYHNDRHYLLMEDTDPKNLPGKSLPVEDLVRPLNHPEVKIGAILYILDTCYSGHGTANIIKFTSEVIQNHQPIAGANIGVHTIAVCRAKDTAQENVFSSALEQVIRSWKGNHSIHPDEIVECINEKVDTQNASYQCAGTETSGKLFFPFVPKTLLTWEEKRHEFGEKLLCILSKELEKSLFFINAFILSSIINEDFVLDKLALKEQLKKLAIKPVSEGICPLIACAEWCRFEFLEQSRNDENLQNLVTEIENWQHEVITYREGVDLSKIEADRTSRYNNLQAKIQSGNLRIQIEIEPQRDTKNNTGLSTGLYILNMNLWIASQKFPFGRFAENVVLELQNDSLEECLKKEDILSNWIRKARYNSFTKSKKPTIEVFLPLSFYQESLEKICFQSGRSRKELGMEYPIFINSFERYFDEDFREIRDEIYQKKQELWGNSQNLASVKVYYNGKKPDLEEIEEDKVIAVWSRCPEQSLTEGKEIKISDWKTWPEKIHNLRKQNEDLKVTLFWDDLYPKPSRRCRPLNTRVVE